MFLCCLRNIKNSSNLFFKDFDLSVKWRNADGTHIPRVNIHQNIGTENYSSRTSIMQYSQSRRDDMESLFYTLTIAVVHQLVFLVKKSDDKDARKKLMLSVRNEFVTNSSKIVSHKPLLSCKSY